jgi:2-dehydropantoate 2-reductase
MRSWRSRPMKTFAILGAGAIGLNYGVRLALSGAEVRFLVRGDPAPLRAGGLRVVEKTRTLELRPAAVFARPEEIGPVDVVLVALKTTANAELSRLLPPLVGPGTLVVTLQNGLGNEELIAGVLRDGRPPDMGGTPMPHPISAGSMPEGGTGVPPVDDRVLGGICFIASTRTGPGEVTCYHPGSITLGEHARPAAERTHALAAAFTAAGVKCNVVDNLAEARWRKLVWNVPFNGLAIAAGGITTDRILADPALAAEVRVLMDEVAAAAARFGYAIPEKFIQGQIDVTRPMGPYQPSSLVDFLAGRAVEIEAIWGEPLRRAQAAGIAMPRLAALYARLQSVGVGR